MDLRERWREMNRDVADTLTSPAEAFAWTKRLTGLTIGISIASVSFALAAIYVQQGSAVRVTAAMALFWSGYLFAHYTATGTLIHQGGEGKTLPGNRFRAVLTVAGVLLILSGITALPHPVVEGDILAASFAGLIAGVGYVAAHYGFTGSLL